MSSLGSVSLINIILYFDVILDVGTGGDGGHVASGELLQLLGLKGVRARLSSDSLCPFRPHSANRYLPQYGGGNAYSSYSINTLTSNFVAFRLREMSGSGGCTKSARTKA